MEVALRSLGDITDRSDLTLWMCAVPPFSTMDMCATPTPAQAVADTSDYGGSLSDASKAAATAQAQSTVAADIRANPQNYSGMCPAGQVPDATSATFCSPCPSGQSPSNGVCVTDTTTAVVMIIALVGILFLLKR